jgi:hypothetical protein
MRVASYWVGCDVLALEALHVRNVAIVVILTGRGRMQARLTSSPSNLDLSHLLVGWYDDNCQERSQSKPTCRGGRYNPGLATLIHSRRLQLLRFHSGDPLVARNY